MAFYNFWYWTNPPATPQRLGGFANRKQPLDATLLMHHVLARGYGLPRMRLRFPLAACEECGTTLHNNWMVLFHFHVVCGHGYYTVITINCS